MNWDDLKFLLAVARTGTVSGAAGTLKVDHATVTRRIARLEARARTPLFIKRQTGYELTPEGRRLLQTAEQVESAVIAGQDTLADQQARVTGVVRIGAPDGFGTFYLPGVLAELDRQHPRLQIELIATARLFSLSRREADIAISLAPPTGARVVGQKLVDYALGLYATQAYLRATPPIGSLDDLLRHRFIGYIEELIYAPELDYLRSIHPRLSAHFRSGNLVAQFNAARAGIGIAVLPVFMAAPCPDLVRVLGREVRLRRAFHILAHEDGGRIERFRLVQDFLVAAAGRDRALFTEV